MSLTGEREVGKTFLVVLTSVVFTGDEDVVVTTALALVLLTLLRLVPVGRKVIAGVF